MATPATLLSQIATAVEAEVSGIARLGCDYRDDLEFIPVGATRYQLVGVASGLDADSNTSRSVETIQLVILHRLADPDDPRAFTEGVMQSDGEALMADSFWRQGNLAAVHELREGPEQSLPERELNLIKVTIGVQVSIVAT